MALFFLYFFRIAAIAVYVLSEWFTRNFVLTVSCFDLLYLDIDQSAARHRLL